MERAQLLQGYAQLTVARDVVERFGFSNAAYARFIARSAVTSSACDVSISRLGNKAKQNGFTSGRASTTELIEAFEDAHMIYQTYEFSYSAQKNERCIYAKERDFSTGRSNGAIQMC